MGVNGGLHLRIRQPGQDSRAFGEMGVQARESENHEGKANFNFWKDAMS